MILALAHANIIQNQKFKILPGVVGAKDMGVVTLNQVGKEADMRTFTISLFGYWVLGIGNWVLGIGYWVFGFWALGARH